MKWLPTEGGETVFKSPDFIISTTSTKILTLEKDRVRRRSEVPAGVSNANGGPPWNNQ
jgi:hypothetical protein